MLLVADLIIPFTWEERQQFIERNSKHYPKTIIELVTGIQITMPARRINRTAKPDTRRNSGVILPEPQREKLIAVTVANGTIVLTTPEKAERIKEKYKYLTEFNK
jgi:hypothetical protein